MIEKLSLYLFVYYFFIRVIYTYYGVELGVSIWIYRVGFYLPLVIWFALILKMYYDNFNDLKSNQTLNIFLFLFFYLMIYISYHKLLGLNYITNDVIIFQIKNLFYSILNILMGVYIFNSLSKPKHQYIFLSVWVLYSVMLLLNLDGLHLNTHGISRLHLLLGDTFALVSIVAIFITFQNKYLKILFFTFALFLVFIISSRASFYALFVVYIFFILKEIGIRNFIGLTIFFILISIFMYKFEFITINTRMFGVFEGKSDGSLNGRLLQFEYGIEAIKNNWFFGEFAGQIVVHNEGYRSGIMGAYMHNWLSYWRQYGLVFFFIFTSLYLYAFFKIFKEWLFKNENTLNIIFYLALFVGIELLIFRSYSDTLVWFVFALMYMYISHLKEDSIETSNLNSIKQL